MIRFAKLTATDDNLIFLNPILIIEVYVNDDGATTVGVQKNGEWNGEWSVKESLLDAVREIEAALRA